jgi:uncharacterized protein
MTTRLLNLDVGQQISLTIDDCIGRSVAILGITGSGKTNTAAVLIEELLANGLPLTIVDIESEYWGLCERFQILVAGRSSRADLPLETGNAAALAELSHQRGLSVILDLSEYTLDEAYEILVSYFTKLWDVASKRHVPYLVALEECHEWIPQGIRTPLKQILTRIALRGRKRGLGMLLMSQRSAKVEKDVLTQASLLFLHRVVHPTDMRVYADLVPLPGAHVEEMVRALQRGQAIVVHEHTPQVVQIRLRQTFHVGSTPTLSDVAQPALRQIDAALLQELRRLLAVKAPESEETALRKAEKRIKELEQLLAARDVELAHLEERIALLSNLRVSMEGGGDPARLQIERAIVEHATINAVQTADLPRVVEAVPAPGMPVNGAVVRSIQRRLEQLSPKQKQVYQLLVEHGTAMTVAEIAAWLGVVKRTAQDYLPPDALVKLGLMRRDQRGNTYLYQATLREFLAKEVPGADPEPILHQLFPKR